MRVSVAHQRHSLVINIQLLNKYTIMGAEVAVGALLGGGALLTSILNAKSSSEANAANIAASKEINLSNQSFQRSQNAQNRLWTEQMYNRQISDALSFWDKQNARQDALIADERLYTSPAAQKQRLKEAGLNAALMGLNGNGSSNVGQVSGIATPSPVSDNSPAPHAEMYAQYEPTNYQSIADALNNSASLFFDNKLKAAQAKGLLQEIDFNSQNNPLKLAYLRQQVEESVSRMKKNRQDTRFAELQGDLMDATMSDQIQMAHFNAVNTEMQGKVLEQQALKFEAERLYTNLQGKIAIERLGLDRQMQQYLIQETLSKIAVNSSIVDLNAAQQHKVVTDAVVESLRGVGIAIDNKRAAAAAAEFITAAKANVVANERASDRYLNNPIYRFGDDVLRYAGDKIGSIFRYLK